MKIAWNKIGLIGIIVTLSLLLFVWSIPGAMLAFFAGAKLEPLLGYRLSSEVLLDLVMCFLYLPVVIFIIKNIIHFIIVIKNKNGEIGCEDIYSMLLLLCTVSFNVFIIALLINITD